MSAWKLFAAIRPARASASGKTTPWRWEAPSFLPFGSFAVFAKACVQDQRRSAAASARAPFASAHGHASSSFAQAASCARKTGFAIVSLIWRRWTASGPS